MFKTLLADYSLIEFIAYGLIGYSGIIALIAQTLSNNTPTSVSLAGIRAIWLVPSVLALLLLSFATGNITTEFSDTTINTLGYNATNSTQLISNVTSTTNTTDKFILQNPVWVPFHFALAIITIVYILTQVFNIFTKID